MLLSWRWLDDRFHCDLELLAVLVLMVAGMMGDSIRFGDLATTDFRSPTRCDCTSLPPPPPLHSPDWCYCCCAFSLAMMTMTTAAGDGLEVWTTALT